MLLQAILDAFQTGGEKAASFRLIAARSGLSAAALVGRFGTGEAMLRAALSHGWDQLLAEVDLIPTLARKSDAERGAGTLSMLKGLGHPHPALLAASLADGTLAEKASAWRQSVVQQIALRGSDRETAEMVFAAWSARNLWERPGGKGFRLGAVLRKLG